MKFVISVAQPANWPEYVPLEEMMGALKEKWDDFLEGKEVDARAVVLAGATRDRLNSVLDRERPEALVLICHGDKKGNISLEDVPTGEGVPLSPQESLKLLEPYLSSNLKLIVLAACYGSKVVEAWRSMPTFPEDVCVVSPRKCGKVLVRSAGVYIGRLCAGLAVGEEVSEAMGNAKRAVSLDPYCGDEDFDFKMTGPSLRWPPGEGKPSFNYKASEHRKVLDRTDPLFGRGQDMLELNKFLSAPPPGLGKEVPRFITVCGEPGLGKSRLSAGVADWHAERGPEGPGRFSRVVEVRAEEVKTAEELAREVGEALRIEVGRDKEVNWPGYVGEFLRDNFRERTRGRLLLVLDNLDDLEEARIEEAQRMFRDWLGAEGLVILATCRHEMNIYGERPFTPEPLGIFSSFNIFKSEIRDSGSVVEEFDRLWKDKDKEFIEAFSELMATLGGLPLAIKLSARRVAERMGPAGGGLSIIEALRRERENLFEVMKVHNLGGLPERQKSLRASLLTSWNIMNDGEKRLFKLMAIFPSGLDSAWSIGPTASLLEDLLGEKWVEVAEDLVRRVGMARATKVEDTTLWWLLPPIREFALDMAKDDEETFKEWISSAGKFWLETLNALEIIPKRLMADRHHLSLKFVLWEMIRHDFGNAYDLLNALAPAWGTYYRAEDWVALGKVFLDIFRKVEPPDPILAQLLNNLGNILSELGHREEALEATGEAVKIRRELARKHPETYLPDLAMSLNNLGNRLSDLGHREEALEATREAVEIRRELARKHPETYLPDLAMSLNNLGVRLSDLGHREEALEATREAVEVYRKLAKEHPEAYLPYLATSLNNLGNRLSELGHREEALEATREAVEVYRELARKHPEAYLPDLAASLNNLGVRLSELGHREEALEVTREAVEIRRELAERYPRRFVPDLVRSLINMARILRDMGNLKGAQETLDEVEKLTGAKIELSELS